MKISWMGGVGTAPGLFKCSCTDQKEKEQTDRQGNKLGEDGKRIVLKKKAESLASLPHSHLCIHSTCDLMISINPC